MKKLNDYQEEIHTCSKCGLCQSVCPVYKVTGNDCSVSRGKFIMLNGIIKGDLELNKNVNKYLDMCLKCNACKNFCPSAIDARNIFIAAKAQYFEKAKSSKLIKFFHSPLIFNTFLKLAGAASNVYRTLKLDKVARAFYPLLFKFELGKRAILANEFVSIRDAGNRNQANKNKTNPPTLQPSNPLAVVYFKGCVNEFINPRAKIATESILKRIGVKILNTHSPLQCCGVPFLSSGNVEQFKKQAIFNLSQIPDDFDYFLTDCASCQNAFAEYKNFIEDEKLLEKIDKIIEKSVNVCDFISKNITSIEFKNKTSITFHKPCHLEDTDFLKEILTKSKNLEYIEMKDFDKCCGFSGEFAIKNQKLSLAISKEKAKNALETKADYVVTSCPACVLGLTQGMIENKQISNIINFVELLCMAEKIC